MNKKWSDLSGKVSEMSLRERLMILIAGLVLFYYPTYSLILSSLWQENSINKSKIQTAQQQIHSTQELIEAIQFELSKDPNQNLEQQRSVLLENIQKKEAEFREIAAELISPELMADLLKRVLSSSKALSLIELSSINPEALIAINASSEQSATLYAHGIRLKLSGDYFNILNFLIKLEKLPESFYWKSLTYQVDEYPIAELEIEIYTLSTKKEFIGG